MTNIRYIQDYYRNYDSVINALDAARRNRDVHVAELKQLLEGFDNKQPAYQSVKDQIYTVNQGFRELAEDAFNTLLALNDALDAWFAAAKDSWMVVIDDPLDPNKTPTTEDVNKWLKEKLPQRMQAD